MKKKANQINSLEKIKPDEEYAAMKSELNSISAIKNNYIIARERVSEWPGYDMHAQVTDTFIPKYKKEYFSILRDMRNLEITEKNCFMVMDKKAFIQNLTKES